VKDTLKQVRLARYRSSKVHDAVLASQNLTCICRTCAAINSMLQIYNAPFKGTLPDAA
jgi:hypothetical protein